MTPKSSSSATSDASAWVSSSTSSSVYSGPRSWTDTDGRRRASREERQLELADLQLVAVGQVAALDPLAVHVRAVQRAEVVDVHLVAAAHQQRVVARHGDVVEEDVRVGPPADRHAIAGDREALPHAPAAGADDERRALFGHDVVELDRDQLTGLADAVGRGRALIGLGCADVRAAARAVVRAVLVGEPAFGAGDG